MRRGMSSPSTQPPFRARRVSSESSEPCEEILFRGRNRALVREAKDTHVQLQTTNRRTSPLMDSGGGLAQYTGERPQSPAECLSNQIASFGLCGGQFSALGAIASDDEEIASVDENTVDAFSLQADGCMRSSLNCGEDDTESGPRSRRRGPGLESSPVRRSNTRHIALTDISMEPIGLANDHASSYFDYMDHERPSVSLGTKKGNSPPFLGTIDASMKDGIISRWAGDRERKKIRKAERELRRAEGLLSPGKANDRGGNLDYEKLKETFFNFMASDSKR